MSHRNIYAVIMFVLTLAGTTVPPSSALAAPDHLIISEVQISGGPEHTTDDFIELYNPTGSPIDFKGLRLVKRTANGTSDTTIKSWVSSTIVPPGGYYLWANSSYTGLTVKPNTSTSQTIANNNAIALRRGPADLGTIIDSLAWGTTNNGLGEGRIFPTNPPTKQALVRKVDSNGMTQDTDSNIDDFILNTVPAPQSTPTIKPITVPPTVTDNNAEPLIVKLGDIDNTHVGELMKTTGLVTKITKTTFTIQNDNTDLRIAFSKSEQAWPQLAVGMRTEVAGYVAVSRGQVELRPRTPADIVVQNNPLSAQTITLTRKAGSSRNGYLMLTLALALLAGSYLWQKYELPSPSALWQRWRHK